MVVMINGSFGVGKSTVAGLLHRMLPGSGVYDPERVGFVLKRLPGWIKLKGAGSGDYQDIDLWRWSVVEGVRLVRFLVSGPVLVPMTFTHRPYFDEVTARIRRFDPDLGVVCLRASLETVEQRLRKRGTAIVGPGSKWVTRRVQECAAALRDPHFGEPVDAEGRPPQEIAGEILARLRQPAAGAPAASWDRAAPAKRTGSG